MHAPWIRRSLWLDCSPEAPARCAAVHRRRRSRRPSAAARSQRGLPVHPLGNTESPRPRIRTTRLAHEWDPGRALSTQREV